MFCHDCIPLLLLLRGVTLHGVMDVVMIFPLLWERIREKMNFLVWEMTMLPFLVEIKEVTIGGATSGILCNEL